jgi:hypothetical protein
MFTEKTLKKYNGVCGLCSRTKGNISPPTKLVIPKKVRSACWMMHVGDTLEGKCYSCKCSILFTNFAAGHIQSEYDGGQITADNLRPICKECNSSCGVMNLDLFKRSLCMEDEINVGGFNQQLEKKNTTFSLLAAAAASSLAAGVYAVFHYYTSEYSEEDNLGEEHNQINIKL